MPGQAGLSGIGEGLADAFALAPAWFDLEHCVAGEDVGAAVGKDGFSYAVELGGERVTEAVFQEVCGAVPGGQP